MQDYLPVLLYCLLILVPIIPAYLLFKLLPSSSATAEGPFQGLQLKLGGAFAGYFSVLLLSFLVINPIIQERQKAWAKYVALLESSVYQDWRVQGRLDLGDGDPALVTAFVRPPDLHIQPDGSFRFQIPMQLRGDGLPDAPILIFYAKGYVPTTVNLLPGINNVVTVGGVTALPQHYDLKTHSVMFDSPIVLKPLASQPAYKPPKS